MASNNNTSFQKEFLNQDFYLRDVGTQEIYVYTMPIILCNNLRSNPF
jgi:hypothetical protein